MKAKYIRDLKPGFPIDEKFMVKACKISQTKAGKPYRDMVLQDKTGTINAKMWDNAGEVIPGAIMIVKGKFELFNEMAQVVVASMTPITSIGDYSDFILESDYMDKGYIETLKNIITTVGKTDWEAFLLNELFIKDNIFAKFVYWPCAVYHHGAYKSGLVDHTARVIEFCQLMINQHREKGLKVNTPIKERLLIIGALIHDYGKLDEYVYHKLTGVIERHPIYGPQHHILRGVLKVQHCWTKYLIDHKEPLIQEEECNADALIGLIQSHHGHKLWGSHRNPQTIEEYMLHMADLSDCRATGIMEGDKTGWDLKSF